MAEGKTFGCPAPTNTATTPSATHTDLSFAIYRAHGLNPLVLLHGHDRVQVMRFPCVVTVVVALWPGQSVWGFLHHAAPSLPSYHSSLTRIVIKAGAGDLESLKVS